MRKAFAVSSSLIATTHKQANMFKSLIAFSAAAVATATPAVEVTMRPGFSLPPALFPAKASCHFEDPFQPAGCQRRVRQVRNLNTL